jgi:ABC-type dipeptide/oligopeptide/nickel transport system permease subunit
VEQATQQATGRVEYFSGEELAARDDRDSWTVGAKVGTGPIQLTGRSAESLGLATHVVDGFDGLVKAYGLTGDIALSEPGWADRLLVLLMDTLYTLPVLLLSVVLAFLLGRGLPNAAAALCVVYVPQYFRVVRNQTAQVKAELFVEAARSLGAGPLWILRRYLLRNVITSVPVLLTLNAADAVLVLGGLGFLGLGLPETIPEWGGDLQQALTAVPTGIWWTALYPGLAMFVLVLGLSFLGEGLESWLSGQPERSS